MADAGDLKQEEALKTSASSENHIAATDVEERERTAGGPSRGDADSVEVALATALDRASAAGEWGAVAQLARELEARRLAAKASVVDLGAERKKRER